MSTPSQTFFTVVSFLIFRILCCCCCGGGGCGFLSCFLCDFCVIFRVKQIQSELINGGGGGDSSSRSRQRKEQREKKLRNKGYFPVSLKFGRPNISQFIEDTVRYSTPPPTPERSEAELMAERLAAKKGPRLAQVIPCVVHVSLDALEITKTNVKRLITILLW